MEYKITFWDRILEKTVLRLVSKSITPNQVTWVRIVLSPLVAYLLLAESYIWGLVIFSGAAFTDAMDGSMARTRNQVTKPGKLLDAIGDRLLIGVVVLILLPRFFGWGVVMILIILEIIHGIAAGVIEKRYGRPGANIAGKAKMFLQSIAIISLFINILGGPPIFLEIAKYGIYISIIPLALQPFMYRDHIKRVVNSQKK